MGAEQNKSVSNNLYTHYEQRPDGNEVEFQWTIFDSLITDEQIARLVAPAEIFNIERGNLTSIIRFHSARAFSYEVLRRVLRFEKKVIAPVRAELEAKAAADSAARFQSYLATLFTIGCSGFDTLSPPAVF
jgi:hypothetical protein